ncbi:uncharacterized protein TA10895 [Theileria annulata]|uniref:Nucleolar protein,Nop52 n=1 Tax=Theileria annulata TaxID=5874 RepID=Q4U973_THEAN|nr:uncharacterized protein TA10895 [Theileria annulata]CAI76630.1 hypothetical protein, conserved [Theileria annulata]|eukprot:XP_953255.1 hypothetical protein, conserved [Theileria annulata]
MMDDIIRSICHNLANTDSNLRKRAIRSVRELFKKNPNLDDLSLSKICKGLYYCLWMSDDPIQTRILSLDIIQLYKSIRLNSSNLNGVEEPLLFDHNEVDIRLRYLKCLMETVSREWLLLDKNRVDKVLLFTRIYVSEILYYMHELNWDLLVLNKLSEIFLNKNIFGRDTLGLLVHVIQVFTTELLYNYEQLKGSGEETKEPPTDSDDNVNFNEDDSKSKINAVHMNLCNNIDSVKLLYILKPFILMFVTSKDSLLLKTIYDYIFKELEKLSKITSVNLIVHLLESILNTSGETSPGKEIDVVKGINKKFIRNTLKLYQSNLSQSLTPAEKLHLEQLLYSIFTIATMNCESNESFSGNEQLNGTIFFKEDSVDLNNTKKESLGNEYMFRAEDYLNLANISTRRMSKSRLRNIHILNSTKSYLLKLKVTDDESRRFLQKLDDTRVKNQLFYYSLIRLRRLKLLHKFKTNNLNKIYNLSRKKRSNFNINLKQALDNIKYVKPVKSSLRERTTSDRKVKRKKKKVVFNLKKNQVTNIPSRKKKNYAPLSLFVSSFSLTYYNIYIIYHYI